MLSRAEFASADQFRDFLQIADKLPPLALACGAVWSAQDRGRMRGSDHVRGKIALDRSSAVSGHAEVFSKQSLRGARSQTNKNFRANSFEFSFKPGATGLDLRLARFLVNAPLSSLRSLPFEMLYHVGDVDVGTIDASFDQGFVEQASCGSDEGMAGLVFAVAGLLSHEHDLRFRGPFAEYGLGCIPPKVASFAGASGLLQIGQSQ